MVKKYFNWPVISAVLVTIVVMGGFNTLAYTQGNTEGSFSTDKTDRTLIKEIYSNQMQEIALLNEIKSMLQASK